MAKASTDRSILRLSWSQSLQGAELYEGEDVDTFATDWHFHEGLQLVAVTRGERHYEFKSGRMVAQPGRLILLPPRFVHRAHCFDGDATSFQIATLPAFCLNAAMLGKPLPWSTTKNFDSFLRVFETLKAGGKHMPTADVISGLGTILRQSHSTSTLVASSAPAFVRQVELHLLQSLEKTPSLGSLSSLAGVSPFHLAHEFTKYIGLSPIAFHARARLMRSRKLIAEGWPLAETSLSLKFSDQSHFGRCFRKVYGMTPGEYQQNLATA